MTAWNDKRPINFINSRHCYWSFNVHFLFVFSTIHTFSLNLDSIQSHAKLKIAQIECTYTVDAIVKFLNSRNSIKRSTANKLQQLQKIEHSKSFCIMCDSITMGHVQSSGITFCDWPFYIKIQCLREMHEHREREKQSERVKREEKSIKIGIKKQ